jgi:hypothetical protein
VVTDLCWAFHRLQRSKAKSAIPGYQDAQRSRVLKALTKTISNASGTGPSNSLPVYLDKDHEDPTTVVYTKNEEETNDLIGCLHGYASMVLYS